MVAVAASCGGGGEAEIGSDYIAIVPQAPRGGGRGSGQSAGRDHRLITERSQSGQKRRVVVSVVIDLRTRRLNEELFVPVASGVDVAT